MNVGSDNIRKTVLFTEWKDISVFLLLAVFEMGGHFYM